MCQIRFCWSTRDLGERKSYFPWNGNQTFMNSIMYYPPKINTMHAVLQVLTHTPGPCLVRFLGPWENPHEPKSHEWSNSLQKLNILDAFWNSAWGKTAPQKDQTSQGPGVHQNPLVSKIQGHFLLLIKLVVCYRHNIGPFT